MTQSVPSRLGRGSSVGILLFATNQVPKARKTKRKPQSTTNSSAVRNNRIQIEYPGVSKGAPQLRRLGQPAVQPPVKLIRGWGRRDSNPHAFWARDPKSRSSANSDTPPAGLATYHPPAQRVNRRGAES